MSEVVHSLGMTFLGGAGVLWMTVGLADARRGRLARRRRELLLGIARVRRPRTPRLNGRARAVGREWAAPVGVGCAAVVLVGGVAGCLLGLAGAYGIRRRQRTAHARTPPPEDESVARQLPLTAELLAACLAAGAAPAAAADAVGRSVDGPMGEALRRVAAEVRLGGDPAQCWERLAAVPQARDLARWMARASVSGVPPVATVSRLANGYRAERTRAAGARARRAGVVATAPLGLCFLPAFLVVGVVPVLIGLAEGMAHMK
ncbi:type II secretion system F family protein [Streptantibioticus parmotrematis]|uniref:type II secretion system F family protein n=1 Tax=Streptantibioticus parmotrematis TaxID=2873249 RepID=UPI00340F4972